MGSIRYFLSLRHMLNGGKVGNLSAFVSSIKNVRYSSIFLRPILIEKSSSICSGKYRFILKMNSSTSSDETKNFKQTKTKDGILKESTQDFTVDNKELEENKVLKELIEQESRKNFNAMSNDNEIKEQFLSTCKIISQDRYKEFQDSDSPVIYSYEEEMHRDFEENDYFFHIDDDRPKFPAKELSRGITGVFDIDELVEILKEEKGYHIAVISIPKEYRYADYMVLVNAKSPRHSRAIGELVNKLYKGKKSKSDPFIKIEGEKYANWKALDMGNIVLHIFLEDTRVMYDIESLWLLDHKYDSGGQQKDEENAMNSLEEQMAFMESLKLNLDVQEQ